MELMSADKYIARLASQEAAGHEKASKGTLINNSLVRLIQDCCSRLPPIHYSWLV